MRAVDYRDCLKRGCAKLELERDSKEGIIAELVDLLRAEGRIENRDAVLRAVLERERQMSTGMQHGIAIPHAKTEAVDRIVTALALKRGGVDFDALDGKPSKFFLLMISPVRLGPQHLEVLSDVSKVLSHPDVRKRLLKAKTGQDLIDILTADAAGDKQGGPAARGAS